MKITEIQQKIMQALLEANHIDSKSLPELYTKLLKDLDIESLINDSNFLRCLENGGVDNWEWYDDAREQYRKEYGNEE